MMLHKKPSLSIWVSIQYFQCTGHCSMGQMKQEIIYFLQVYALSEPQTIPKQIHWFIINYLMGSNKGDRARLFSVVCSEKRGNGDEAAYRKFHLNLRKSKVGLVGFFLWDNWTFKRVAKRLCGTSLEVLKMHWDAAMSNPL